MADSFDLIVTADSGAFRIDLRLMKTGGGQVAARSVDFRSLLLSLKQALFDLRSYLRLYVEKGHEEESVAKTGVFLAEEILGEEIFLKLWYPQSQRSLRVLLPRAKDEGNPLGAALTRIPWEIARPSPKHQTLGERNLLVRVVHDMEEPATKPIDLGKDGTLRVLFVFAEARISSPLSGRRERREIEQLFEREIYPNRKIVVDFLTHGVTRERLREQIKNRSGYHVVHWSGHGHLNLLELSGRLGLKDRLSGEELVELFAEAGGFLPQLVFLSACHSGDVQQVKDWQGFLSAARGEEPGSRGILLGDDHPGRDIPIEVQPGYTGTAHALIQGGVPSVVAMRYAVGDEYARNLAIELYRALLAHSDPKSVPAALALARKELLRHERPDASRFDAADHATPVLYGAEDPGLRWVNERSSALDTRDRRRHRIPELTIAEHPNFVGRSWELAELGSRFISTARSTDARPVALVAGLGGMGKTALAAEALDLWEQRFEWVLLYQAKPNALGFEATFRDIHVKLWSELGRYHKHVTTHPADAIHREASPDFSGPERIDRLTRNLIEALRAEPILVVLDNFESNLKATPEPDGSPEEPLWACQDTDWDFCLHLLATELVGSPSRILITCRHQLAALRGEAAAHCLRVRLGPLPAGEAALFLREHVGLSRMLFGTDPAEKAHAERLLKASRFHPLLMDRLARLATGGPDLRTQLMAALDAIETNHDATQLPELFAIERGDPVELAYLEDALSTSIDELIRGASPEARRLLWMIAVANEPVALEMVSQIWRGSSLTPLLAHLIAVGLATEEQKEPSDGNPDLTCHELVRERICGWMVNSGEDRGELTVISIRAAYAERLEETFSDLLHKSMATALEAGRRALVYCVQAEAWDLLGSFASWVGTSSNDPALLKSLIPYLQAAAESAPEGQPRWRCLTYLADALRQSGRPDASLPFYEQAAAQARAVAEAAGDGAQQAWSNLGWISGNWANALVQTGNLDAARQRRLENAEAHRKAASPEIHILAPELEALRIDMLQGKAAEVMSQVDSRLARVEAWWQQHRAGQPTPEAPDPKFLVRVLIGALDIARKANYALRDWEAALRNIDAILAILREQNGSEEEIAIIRMNRANALAPLGRFGEAKDELEICLEILQNDRSRTAMTLSSLTELFAEQGDLAAAIEIERRALALREQLPDPRQRGSSHADLADYLERSGHPTGPAESPRHQLAALVYYLISELWHDTNTLTEKYFRQFLQARESGIEREIPRLAELLADPAFRPLEAWLRGRGVDVTELQARVDQFLASAREVASESP